MPAESRAKWNCATLPAGWAWAWGAAGCLGVGRSWLCVSGTQLLVTVLSWASLAFCHQGWEQSLTLSGLFTGMSVLLCGWSEGGLTIVRPRLCSFGRRRFVL